MGLLDDPEMKEVVLEFCEESEKQFDELEKILEDLEEDPKKLELLESFGQVIDRVMGAAQTLGVEDISTFCELGKSIGYKASQAASPPLVEVSVAVLFDSVDLLRKMVTQLRSGNDATDGLNIKAFTSRLEWLAEKFKDVEWGSVAIDKANKATGEGEEAPLKKSS